MPIWDYMRPIGTKAELEVRRRRAIALLLEGRRVREVAELVAASPSSVSRWKSAYEAGGDDGLRSKPHPGRKPKLSKERRKELEELLLQGPMAHGYRTDLWTLGRVAQVIEKHFGVRYHPGNVWRVLRQMRWSCQKPERRARERDEEAIHRWRKETWPQIKKKSPGRAEHRHR